MDVHVRRAISTALRSRGVDVLTAQMDETTRWEDATLLDRATSLGRVVFTQDNDFLIEGAKRQRTGETFAGIIFAHQLHVSLRRCIDDLELISKVYEPADLANRVEFLPLQ